MAQPPRISENDNIARLMPTLVDASIPEGRDNEQDISTTPMGDAAIAASRYKSGQNRDLEDEDADTALDDKEILDMAGSLTSNTARRIWDGRKSRIGDVSMTNAETQDTRNMILSRGDHFANRAVEGGLIQPSEKEDFKNTIREMRDLKKAERANGGTMTPEQQQRWAELEQSKLGQAANTLKARVYKETPALQSPETRLASNTAANAVYGTPKADAPPLGSDFSRATDPVQPNLGQTTQRQYAAITSPAPTALS